MINNKNENDELVPIESLSQSLNVSVFTINNNNKHLKGIECHILSKRKRESYAIISIFFFIFFKLNTKRNNNNDVLINYIYKRDCC